MTEEIQKAVAYKLEQVVDSNDVQLISRVLWHDFVATDSESLTKMFADHNRNLGLCGSRIKVKDAEFKYNESGSIYEQDVELEVDFLYSNSNAGETGYEGSSEQQFQMICKAIRTEFTNEDSIKPSDINAALTGDFIRISPMIDPKFANTPKFIEGKAAFMMTFTLHAIQTF